MAEDKIHGGEPQPSTQEREENPEKRSADSKPPQRKHPGWRAISFILGNETFERLASLGLVANFMVYLMREFHMTQVTAANIINIWGGVSNFAPLIGAFISDAYSGRYNSIAVASFGSLLEYGWVFPLLLKIQVFAGDGSERKDFDQR